ncbi:hypothetical protein N7452_001507 [Penicillium brevicompactum]|uniref:Uncharacterized protein n=1 Tax=Penicillium brevicompactum TaxID=5074 RepID=A0A9W9R2I1_PENBR|nr:hypothetical protein N7452_001507 [Penicillium brevicompactum]
MSFPESNKFSHAKHPKYFRMDNSPQTPAQDPEAREQRKQSELAGFNEQTQRPSSMASGSSVADFGNSVSSLAQESAGVVKETVVEGVPKALHAVQEGISAIAGGAKEVEETVSDNLSAESQAEFEHIDNMSNERVCDFLRQKHMSNTHPRSTN